MKELLQVLGSLERAGGDRATRALDALETRDGDGLARALGTSLEEANRLLTSRHAPSAEVIERDVERYARSLGRKRRGPRKINPASLAWALSTAATAAVIISAVFRPPPLSPAAAAVLDIGTVRGQHVAREVLPRGGEAITVRVKPAAKAEDLRAIVVFAEHEGKIRAFRSLDQEEREGVVELRTLIPRALEQESCTWEIWLAHARDPAALPRTPETFAAALRSPPETGPWRLVHVTPELSLPCPSGQHPNPLEEN